MIEFAQLVEVESRGLIAAVTAIVGDRHRAEEIVQDSFERCYRRWRRVSKLDRPGAWVRRVAINAAISATRRSGSERRALARVGSRGEPVATGGFNEDRGVWSAVRALPTEQAVVIALRYGADLTIEEIAATLQLSESAVKSRLHRGRTALRASTELQSYAAG